MVMWWGRGVVTRYRSVWGRGRDSATEPIVGVGVEGVGPEARGTLIHHIIMFIISYSYSTGKWWGRGVASSGKPHYDWTNR